MNDLDRAVKFKQDLHGFINLVGDPYGINDEDYIVERNFFISNYLEQSPSFLRDCRTSEDFINKLRNIASGGGSWQVRRDFIEYEFEEFLQYLEFGTNTMNLAEASIDNSHVSIELNDVVFSHVRKLLENKHYFNAVEESYKIVRNRLREITGEEQAHKAFSEGNTVKIFGYMPENEPESNFFEGVKYLHMAIQRLRNEKAHTPAGELDKNLAIHYIVLASLSYDLITRK